MSALPTDLRKQFRKAIIAARREAEAGSRRALESLAVERHEPYGSMSPEARSLRNRLRARGRQLGDVRDRVRGTQSIDRLVHEIAYEHWHRMLFARFLAENGLLIESDSGVAITMEECEELAREAGKDPRDMAARFAQDSLPRIFRSGDPVLELTLAPESRQALDKLLDSLPAAVFAADDSLGWTYQYWQVERKAEVNASGNKIGADELPAVTQLFTEPYMVQFLFHNTIGAWHSGKVLSANLTLAETAQSEEELRQAVRLRSHGGYDFEYLRFVREPREGDDKDTPTGPWRPAAGIFDGWPKTAMELKVLDPCCGSGHFLVEGFELLVRLRMDEDGIDLETAIRSVLADNLLGLELDPRCTQIAAFNLAMAAWKLAGRPIKLPLLTVACSGLAVGSTKQEWSALAGNDERLRAGMERLCDLFEQAPVLGSLIDPKALAGDLLVADFAELQPLLEQALERESDDVEDTERAVAAQGMARAAELLSGRYTLAITNVPYLGRKHQSESLTVFADSYYETSKADLATIFVERMFQFLQSHGTVAAVTSQTWLFLTSYKDLREKLLQRRTWNLVARLGTGAFETISGHVVNVALPVISSAKPSEAAAIAGVDASPASTPADKAALLRGEPVAGLDEGQPVGVVVFVPQSALLLNPGAFIQLESSSTGTRLDEFALGVHGTNTKDSLRFIRKFDELPLPHPDWRLGQTTTANTSDWSGYSNAYFWQQGEGVLQQLYKLGIAILAGGLAWDKRGVLVSQTGSLPVSQYQGSIFDQNAAAIVPKDPMHTPAIWAYCSSDEFSREVRKIDQALKVTNNTLVRVPFDLEHWQKVAADQFPEGLPAPQSDDPGQWLFHGHPAKAESAAALQVAVGRLVGYRWPPELDPEMYLADEAREWVGRCDALKEYADQDGIVCLSPTRGESSAADRLRRLLAAAFGSDWTAAKERELISVAGDGTRPAASLETWLRDKFFEEHCKLFYHRPFVWHIWDGNKDGFSALVNAHRLTGPDGESRRILQTVTFSYLGDWIERQRADQRDGKEGADGRLAAALDLQGQLEKILEGEPPYDLFVRWKPLSEQAIGWEPDINDGVRLNIRPCMKAELRAGGRKAAGILRWKPNIKWNKDRGKEPQSLRPKADYPWFWGFPGDGTIEARTDYTAEHGALTQFDGNRWNDLHYSNSCKQAVRASVGAEARA